MKIKKLIYNLFFKKRRKSNSKRRTSANIKNGKYDLSGLRDRVSETEYIQNLRLGRSWILPQLVRMGFKGKWHPKFDMNEFESSIKRKYNSSAKGRTRIWELLKRNYHAIAVSGGESKRALWWTRDLLSEIMRWDNDVVEGGSRSNKMRLEVIQKLEQTTDSIQIYSLLEEYHLLRWKKRKSQSNAQLPNAFINAFEGDGAYSAMMTMVKILGIRIKDDAGNELTRQECIDEIERKANELSGHELLEYCKKKFFDSGAFNLKCYLKI